MKEIQNKAINATSSETINLRAEIEKYLIHWKWFLISSFICLALSVLYLKTQKNQFETFASILVKEDGGASTDLKVFQDMTSLGLRGGNNVYDEIEVLKSRALTRKYVEKLNLNIRLLKSQGLKEVELYGTKNPLRVKVLSDLKQLNQLDTFININILDEYQFKYTIEEGEEEQLAKFGEKIKVGDTKFVLLPNDNGLLEGEYLLEFNKLDDVIESYRKKIMINSIDTDSNIVSLSMNSPVKEKAQLVLNTLIDLYNQMTIDDQNLVGKKTDQFISKRLEVIKGELDDVDRLEELYKKDKQITDIKIQSQLFVDSKSKNEEEVFKKETELRLVNFMIQNIQENPKEDFSLLPANILIENNVQLGTEIGKYNELLFERNRLLRTSSIYNPVVQNLNKELKSFIENINQSLLNSKKQLEIGLNSLKSIENQFNNRISSLPKQVREYRGILRRQEIIAQLYSYLLQKKEENEITMAVTVAKSKVIDRAYSNAKPVGPKKKVIALAGLVIGLLIPLVIIYITDLLDTKLKSKKDLENTVSIPYLGDIPLDKTGEKIVVKKGSRSSVAEAFRLLRTNLDFMLTSIGRKCKTIFVTSTISGEGKTFVAVNTGASIALTGKKVLLIGMDLRAPKITQYLDLPNRNGVTNYLVDKEIELDDLVHPLEGHDSLYILSSGVVPPNPAELLLSPRLEELFVVLKQSFDYIVVDTAPVNLVTDTLMISKHADLVLYTSRANYLDKRFLEVPERLYQEKRLPNMAFLLNALDYTRGYGYGYGGYGYPKEHEQKGFFQNLFRK